jgi:hypothetical protein
MNIDLLAQDIRRDVLEALDAQAGASVKVKRADVPSVNAAIEEVIRKRLAASGINGQSQSPTGIAVVEPTGIQRRFEDPRRALGRGPELDGEHLDLESALRDPRYAPAANSPQEDALIALASRLPTNLQNSVNHAHRTVTESRSRFRNLILGAPVAPDALMLRAHLDSGFLDTWFQQYLSWYRKAEIESR